MRARLTSSTLALSAVLSLPVLNPSPKAVNKSIYLTELFLPVLSAPRWKLIFTGNNMKQFTISDTRPFGTIPNTLYLFAVTSELVVSELPWQKRGLQETASGYGARLTSSFKIHYEGKLRRLYVTQYGNSGSHWFKTKGTKVFVS
jgi:hypothetical protein